MIALHTPKAYEKSENYCSYTFLLYNPSSFHFSLAFQKRFEDIFIKRTVYVDRNTIYLDVSTFFRVRIITF